MRPACSQEDSATHGSPIEEPAPATVAEAFIERAGRPQWQSRLASLRAAPGGSQAGRAMLRRYAAELTIERLRQVSGPAPLSPGERALLGLAAMTERLFGTLAEPGRVRLEAMLQEAMAEGGTLIPLFHLLRTAGLQASRGFAVRFAGLEQGAPFDLLLSRNGVEAELACEVVSAEDGRNVHRGAWFQLVDRIDPELQTWLAAHPGRYLLKMTLPRGLREDGGPATLADLHGRISALLADRRRSDQDEAAVLRLDPLLLVAAQADELGLMSRLRREFGPEAHLAVTSAGQGIFVMAARAGQENDVAAAVRRRMEAIAPVRLTGTRPGILAMFVEDTDRAEWQGLRERLELEGETRQFLTSADARPVVAVSCASRLELFDLPVPEAAPEGELRFRNPAHPAARVEALAPSILSSN